MTGPRNGPLALVRYWFLAPLLSLCMVLGVLVVRTQPPASVPSPAADAFFIAANRLAVAGKFMEAIQAYRQALSVKPDLADAHFAIAMAQSRWWFISEDVVLVY